MFDEWLLQIKVGDRQFSYATGASQVEWPSGQARLEVSDLSLGHRLRIVARASQLPSKLQLRHPREYKKTDRLLGNGWQSWSETRTYSPGQQIKPLRRIAKPYMGFYGDTHHELVGQGPNRLHSWSWGQISQLNTDEVELFASCNEWNAFTLFEYRVEEEGLTISPDLAGWLPESDQEVVLLDVLYLKGKSKACYDCWQNALQLDTPGFNPQNGWTSWYQYYQHITPEILNRVLNNMAPRLGTGDIFQVDDGYSSSTGDWLDLAPAFKANDLPDLAASIKTKGLRPGIWLAPTVAADNTKLLQRYPHLALKDNRGKLLKAGYNPGWGGYYRALDTEHPDWLTYIEQVVNTQCGVWGFEMLKLDFLFTACLYPRVGFTRAQLMRRCLERLREWAGPEVALLGCGTPLASGFGLFDYCRISADIHLKWEHQMLAFLRHRERVSTRIALRSTAFRHPLNGRMWHSDPDVFLLRDRNQKLSQEERQVVLRLNTLLGDLCFTSDDPGTYGSWQNDQWKWFEENRQRKVDAVIETKPLHVQLDEYSFDLSK